MDKKLLKSKVISGKEIQISGSKSETNRLLVLQALYPQIVIQNTSSSDDSEAMQKALKNNTEVIDIHHAGTAMRFLTAFFASQAGKSVILTGSQRMKERPIHILVTALRDLGAEISYLETEGFPPLHIEGKNMYINSVDISANVSSQYISALMLIAPSLPNGLKICLNGEVTSAPYINMTISLLTEIGIKALFDGKTIDIAPLKTISPKTIVVESDWSSASYWYSFIALSEEGTSLTLSNYKKNSLQGDCILAEIYTFFGVETVFLNNKIMLYKKEQTKKSFFEYNLINAPDIAQTIAVTCFALGVTCHLSGLHTLKIKETDRLKALHTELTKLGADIEITTDSLYIKEKKQIHSGVAINTYNDHRMAMAFAPLMLQTDLTINNCEVVSKSYPSFWNDVENVLSSDFF